ncbi:MAG: hypothetical protein ACHQ2Z_07615, partial [Elusimicrobiota bacterium]
MSISRKAVLSALLALGAAFAAPAADAGTSINLGDVAVTVTGSPCQLYKLSAVDGSIIWGPVSAVGPDCTIAVDQRDLSVYVGNGSHINGNPGTLTKYNSSGGFSWSNNVPGATSGGCTGAYYVSSIAVDTTSASPGVVPSEQGCFGYVNKNSTSTGANIWATSTNDLLQSALDPANGQIYSISVNGHNQMYSVTAAGAPTSTGWTPEGGQGPEMNPVDRALYYASGSTLYQMSTTTLGTSNWTMSLGAVTGLGNLAVQPWKGGFDYLVDNGGSKIIVVNPAKQTIVRTFATSLTPQFSAVNPLGGAIYISSNTANFVQAVDHYGTVIWTSPNLGAHVISIAAPRNTVGAPNPPLPAGCASGFNVSKSTWNSDFTTIMGAVGNLPTTLTGNTCIVIRDTSTYNEQVFVTSFTNAGYHLTIEADPSFTSSAPVIS